MMEASPVFSRPLQTWPLEGLPGEERRIKTEASGGSEKMAQRKGKREMK